MMFFGKSWEVWVSEYEQSHQNKWNRFLHLIGIPTVVLSIFFLIFSVFSSSLIIPGVLLFVVGWVCQFLGHAVEGKPPEFLKDWRFLFVGVRWWIRKMKS